MISITEVPQQLKNAVIAAEDERFYEHPGIDYLGVMRAAWANFRAGAIRQGGSTITQQLAKSLLPPGRTMGRKLRDMLPKASELWLDGAHNAHGAAALARSLEEMQARRPLPLVLIIGMMNTREPRDFLEPFSRLRPKVLALPIPGEPNAHPSDYIASKARKAGFEARAFRSLGPAMNAAAEGKGRVLIGGSLYLAGHVLYRNGTPPD